VTTPQPVCLAVVLGTRNRLPQLRDCLQSLVGKIAVPHKIVVVELGSSDGTWEYLQAQPGIRLVIDSEPLGQARNLNRVFKSLAAKYICWLSDDNVVLEGMLDLAVSVLEARPEFGLVALKVKDVTGPSAGKDYIGSIAPTGVLNCNQGVVRASLFKQVGYFDERYRTYGIDPDLTMKVLLAGYQVAYTKPVAIHHYREHARWPGAIDDSVRAAQQQAAKDLYWETYQAWVRPRSPWLKTLYHALRHYFIYPVYGAARRAGRPLEAWLGYSERDWSNMLHGRYISKLDLLKNRRNPYYLVQRMPAPARPASLVRP
jgi:glycosyltransferase involved in cell wall biosynthesis